MKYLKKFESFRDDQEYDYSNDLRSIVAGRADGLERDSEIDYTPSELSDEYSDELRKVVAGRMSMEEEEEECVPCNDEDENDKEKDMTGKDMSFEAKNTSYKKSGLKNPEKADLNKDKKISRYEKKRGKAIEDSIEKRKEKGLTPKQKKLPKALRDAIAKGLRD